MKVMKSKKYKYRVKKITLYNGEIYYIVQFKEIRFISLKYYDDKTRHKEIENAIIAIKYSIRNDNRDFIIKKEIVKIP